MVKSTIAFLSVSLVILLMASGMATANLFSDRGLYPAACIITDPSATTLNDVAQALEKNGVRGLQMFPPNVIFGQFPAHVNASIFEGMHAELVASPEDIRLKSLSPLVRGAARALMREDEIFRTAIADDVRFEPFEDLVLEVPDEVKRQWKYEGPRKGSPGEITQRGIDQNTEFLIGTILINIVFPESNGGSENWTDEELSAASAAISVGLSQYQQHALWLDPLRMTFVINYFERVPVSIEPIEGDMNTDPIWISDALLAIDPDYHGNFWGTHMLNNAKRQAYIDQGVQVDWVFTAYVADASASPGNCWQGSSGGYAAYAYLGGPYMVCCYPPCRFGAHEFGFAHVFIHEMGHVFWALDEYASAETPCNARSGYMNVENLNTYYNPCQTLVDCIMNNYELAWPLPICDYTLGQIGLWDEDPRNSIVDIFEEPPRVIIRIAPGQSDTLSGEEEYPVDIVVENDAKENKNPGQDPLEQIDYAPWIRSATYSLNDQGIHDFLPNDTKWDESHELAAFWMSGFIPGRNVLRVTAENCVRAVGQAEREYYYVGIKYYETSGKVSSDYIDLKWVTAGEVFGSVFDVMREDLTVGTGEVLIGQVEEADEAGARNYYSFRDEAIMAGHEYVYHVIAKFRLGVNGVVSDFEFPSREIEATAMIPVTGDLLSYIVPNPTDRSTTFTVKVPSSYYDPSGSNQRTSRVTTHSQSATQLMEVKTPVDVRVFDVNGRLIKTIYSNETWGGFRTETWDGTDRNGKDVVSGVYFIRVVAGGKKDVRKVVVIR